MNTPQLRGWLDRFESYLYHENIPGKDFCWSSEQYAQALDDMPRYLACATFPNRMVRIGKRMLEVEGEYQKASSMAVLGIISNLAAVRELEQAKELARAYNLTVQKPQRYPKSEISAILAPVMDRDQPTYRSYPIDALELAGEFLAQAMQSPDLQKEVVQVTSQCLGAFLEKDMDSEGDLYRQRCMENAGKFKTEVGQGLFVGMLRSSLGSPDLFFDPQKGLKDSFSLAGVDYNEYHKGKKETRFCAALQWMGDLIRDADGDRQLELARMAAQSLMHISYQPKDMRMRASACIVRYPLSDADREKPLRNYPNALPYFAREYLVGALKGPALGRVLDVVSQQLKTTEVFADWSKEFEKYRRELGVVKVD